MATRITALRFRSTFINGVDQGTAAYTTAGWEDGYVWYDVYSGSGGVGRLPDGLYFDHWEFSFSGPRAPEFSPVARTHRYEIGNPDDASSGGTMYGRLFLRDTPYPPAPTYRLTVTFVADPAAGGEAYSDSGTQTKTYVEDVGVDVIVTGGRTANPGYRFVKWVLSDGWVQEGVLYHTYHSPSEPGEYTLTATAVFVSESDTVTVRAHASPAGAGSVNGVAEYVETVSVGGSVSLEALRTSNRYRFVRWTRVEPSSPETHRTSNPATIANVLEDQVWVAEFEEATKATVDVVIVPRPNSHGRHGIVRIEPSDKVSPSDVVLAEDNGSYDIFTGSTTTNLRASISVAADAGCRFVSAKLNGITYTPESFVSLNTRTVNTLLVFFGCDKLMYYDPDPDDRLLRSSKSGDRGLVYCG